MHRTRVPCLLAFAFVLFLGFGLPQRAGAAELVIKYERDDRGLCVGATATLDGRLVGKATMIDLVKGSHFVVREIQYAPRTGAKIYEAVSKFAIGFGEKLEEKKVSGRKRLEIFTTWPR
jgi:hypothetical protein